MNKIVRENYPASNLPPDLREGVDPNSTVTVVITSDDSRPPEDVMSLDEILSLSGFRRRSAEEISADIRRERDEWDD